MNDNRVTVREWLDNFKNGLYSAKDTKTQCEAGWYDWFCKDSSLRNKTHNLAPKVKRIAKSSKIDVDRVYVFFKNNCPLCGILYDDFRFCDLETGDVIYTIIPSSGHNRNKGLSEIWGRENGFDEPLFRGDWNGVLEWFEVN